MGVFFKKKNKEQSNEKTIEKIIIPNNYSQKNWNNNSKQTIREIIFGAARKKT
eukprot:SAG25_NODE_177_length_12713_cov_474.755272_8_plen_53_part_00